MKKVKNQLVVLLLLAIISTASSMKYTAKDFLVKTLVRKSNGPISCTV